MDVLIKKVKDFSYLFPSIVKDVTDIIKEETFNYGQLCLTHTRYNVTEEEKLYFGTGSLLLDGNPNKVKTNETDFTVFNDRFKNTSLYELYNLVPNVGRFRIMVMDGPKCYTVHKDFTKRYHLVIQSNEKCFFVFPDLNELVKIPFDMNLYELNTLHSHTFVNGSRERRIHLVLDDISTYIL